MGFLSLTTIEADAIYMFGCSGGALFLFTQLFLSDMSTASPQRIIRYALSFFSVYILFFFLFVCLFSNQIIICLLVNHTGAVGLPKSTSVVQTEISLYLFDGLPIKFYTDIHGSREWSLLTSVISHFSSSGMMRLAFMGHRQMSQQLLDGCN